MTKGEFFELNKDLTSDKFITPQFTISILLKASFTTISLNNNFASFSVKWTFILFNISKKSGNDISLSPFLSYCLNWFKKLMTVKLPFTPIVPLNTSIFSSFNKFLRNSFSFS